MDRCTNEKVVRVSIRILPWPNDDVSFEIMGEAVKHCELRFEENSFGCIHHKRLKEKEK